MTAHVIGEVLLNTAQIGDFLQVAVLLKFNTLSQQITKSRFKDGNDLVTVLLT